MAGREVAVDKRDLRWGRTIRMSGHFVECVRACGVGVCTLLLGRGGGRGRDGGEDQRMRVKVE